MFSSSFTDLPNASSVGSLNHATLSNCVRRSVVCIPNMSTFRAFRSFVCLSVFACTPVHSNSLTTSTDSLARIAGALTKQLSVLPLSKHVSHTCLTSSSSTRVFHTLFTRSVSAQEPAAAVLQSRRQPNPGKWTGNGAAAQGDCSFRPLAGRPAWPNATSSSPIPARQRPLVGLGQLPNTTFRQRSR